MSILLPVANPFSLPTPSAGWLNAIADYDPDLRVVPSQTAPVYRLMRLARRTGSTNAQLWLDKGLTMCADTVIAFQHRLVPITTLPGAAVLAPVEHVVQWLKDHDLTAHGGADAVCDQLEAREVAKDRKIDAANHDEGLQRHRASRIGYQYRTGARVSLIRPIRRHTDVVSPFTPPSTQTPARRLDQSTDPPPSAVSA